MRPHLPKHPSRDEDQQPGLPEKAVPNPHKTLRRIFRPRVSQGQMGESAPGLRGSWPGRLPADLHV